MNFRKKPVVISAVQWDGTNVSEISQHFGKFTGWGLRNCEFLVIETLEGQFASNPGDWIIRGVKGEYYPCKPDIFAEIYEPAE